jgi:hypothetical protein
MEHKICLEAVKQNGLALQYIKFGQTEDMCLEAIKQNKDSFQYSAYRTPKIMKEYNKKKLGCLFSCPCKSKKSILDESYTPENCLEAVRKNGLALKNVNVQTPELCLEAVRQNGLALQFVWNSFLSGNV